jgi:hypothetical protein
MIAVVDFHAERGIEIGTASSPRLPGSLVDSDTDAARGKIDCRGEPRQAGADDVNRARPQRTMQRKRIQTRLTRRSLTRARGASHPRATNCDRIRR